MKYVCLVYCDEDLIPTLDDSHCVDFDEGLRRDGRCIASEALQPVATATSVRLHDGKAIITDGPFAETKEQLAGFYLIDAETREEAVEIASKIPSAVAGGIEVRPVRPLPGRVLGAS